MLKKWQNKEWLEKEYGLHGTSTIAKKCNRDDSTIRYWLQKFKIPLRTRSESLKLTDSRKAHIGRPRYFKDINSHEKAYWLGFLMADGTMREYRPNCYMICFELAIKDEDVVQTFAKAVDYNGKIYRDSERCRVMITCDILTKDLLKYGICPNKTAKEIIPDIDAQYYSSFIRGFFDGDGSILFKKCEKRVRVRFHLVCANILMLEHIKDILVQYAHVKPTPKIIHEKYTKGALGKRPVFELEISSMPNVAKIYDYLYNGSVYMDRKKKIFDSYMSYYVTSQRVVKRYSPNCLETSRTKQK